MGVLRGDLDRASDGLTTELERVREEMVGVFTSVAELEKASKAQSDMASSLNVPFGEST